MVRDGDPLREVLSVGRRTSSGDRAGSLGVRRMLQRSNGANRGRRGTGAQASGGGVAGAAQGTYGVMSLFPPTLLSESPLTSFAVAARAAPLQLAPRDSLNLRVGSLYCSSSQFVFLS